MKHKKMKENMEERETESISEVNCLEAKNAELQKKLTEEEDNVAKFQENIIKVEDEHFEALTKLHGEKTQLMNQVTGVREQKHAVD